MTLRRVRFFFQSAHLWFDGLTTPRTIPSNVEGLRVDGERPEGVEP